MQKVCAFCLAFCLFCGFVNFSGQILKNSDLSKQINDLKPALNYNASHQKFNCAEAMDVNLRDDNVMLLCLSSESADISDFDPQCQDSAHPKRLFNNGNSDFNICLLGTGNNKCLNHVIHIGAFSGVMKNKKAAIILSPQWFIENDNPMAFSSNFYPRVFDRFVENKNLSNVLKNSVIDSSKQMLSGFEPAINRLKLFERSKQNSIISPIFSKTLDITGQILDKKFERRLVEYFKNPSSYKPETVISDKINYNELLKTVEKEGEKCCTSNQLCIYDWYYNNYVKPTLSYFKNSWVKSIYEINQNELKNLRLFIEVCLNLDIKPLLISMPFHGPWSDYTGFTKEYREKCYESIRQVVNSYDVNFLDLTDHEYEKYFLRDIMHVGWKGWVYIDEAIYKFYKQN
ncbi:MAG: D-alanyl-lipoteichoic acid biosynthesis protein DltD [Oscillospiraceae bacterium]|jgi:D-alanine transfer protein|nr:D-alanyl-lipoteichoic acid biosynthesis protein DltD [Oscillospiraceae bacterium]